MPSEPPPVASQPATVPRAAGVRRVLGVDPGTRVAGWGVVDWHGNRARMVGCGAIRTKGKDMPQRLRQIYDGLVEVAELHLPDVVAVEKPFMGKNAQSTLAIGMARAVALLVGAQRDLECAEYSPAMIKKAVVGNGAAGKEQVGAMVRVILGLAEQPRPADATDALAVALTHTHRSGPAIG